MRERRISGAHLSLSWHHTRSFCQRSRAESEQSRGSFARRTIIFILAGRGRVEASDAPRRLWIYEFESSFPGQPPQSPPGRLLGVLRRSPQIRRQVSARRTVRNLEAVASRDRLRLLETDPNRPFTLRAIWLLLLCERTHSLLVRRSHMGHDQTHAVKRTPLPMRTGVPSQPLLK
jgi:hypothetical protein